MLYVEKTEVVRSTSLDSPYRGVASGKIYVTTAIRLSQTGPGYQM